MGATGSMYVLGIWDGHDSGAALVDEKRVIYAANEERFTKRKLEVRFPYNSIKAALAYEGIKPSDIRHVAFTTAEFTKTLERLFPGMKENYYNFRRRKIPRPSFENLRHNLKYTMTTVGVLPFCREVSSSIVARRLRHMGFRNFKLHLVEHHTAHAATAAFTSHMNRSLVITLDGLGDGLSGSISTLDKGKFERHVSLKARDSLGIFFEQVTNISGMRELEDEGKIMAMADYSYPFSYEENRLADFIKVDGVSMKAAFSPTRQYNLLQKIAWQVPREQFAYMAQQVLEKNMKDFVANAVDEFGIHDIALSGGVLSNIKANMNIRKLNSVRKWYVFPHMGDGGIALGAALYTQYMLTGNADFDFNAYLGSSYSEDETKKALRKEQALEYHKESDSEHASHAAELLSKGEYFFWFQDRMEYGQRALGHRSILAPADSEKIKDRLNLYVKKREWFQPFAPSMLEGEVSRMIDFDNKGFDRFMTMAYAVKEPFREKVKSVVHVDMTARPQMVGKENPLYSRLLEGVKRRRGNGIVLNTSFNLHGLPIVMSPEDAIKTMKETGTRYMFMNGFFVTNKKAVK